MGKAIFMALSVAIFVAYSLVANALLIPNETISPIGLPGDEECVSESAILLPGDPCYEAEASRIPIIGDFLAGLSNAFEVATNLFSGFFQLITFQARGLESASLITALIFVPLGFANAFIVFSAIRGSS